MLTLLAVAHLIIAVGVILFVLLQDPKGGAMGAFTGGNSANSFFGSSGASNFLATTTKWLAILFAISCLVLTYLTAKKGSSVMDSYAAPAASAPVAPVDPATSAPLKDAAPAPVKAEPGPAPQQIPPESNHDKK